MSYQYHSESQNIQRYNSAPPAYTLSEQQPNPTCTTPLVVRMQSPPNDYLCFVIFTCLFCFWPTAIVALIYSNKVNDRYNAGDHVGAMQSSRKASQWAKISLMIGLIPYLLCIALFVAILILFATDAVAVAVSRHSDN
jgi:glycerol uptake facilitator-like aquaporin